MDSTSDCSFLKTWAEHLNSNYSYIDYLFFLKEQKNTFMKHNIILAIDFVLL